MRKKALTLMAGVVLVLTVSTAMASPRYELIDLGEGSANSINDAGQIVGWIRTAGNYNAVLFDSTGNRNNISLGTLGGNGSWAQGINDTGQIVGWANDMEMPQATLFDATGGGANIGLGTLVGTFPYNDFSVAESINNAGQIVGASPFPPDNVWWPMAGMSACPARATLFDPTGNEKNIDLGTLGADYSWAYSINNLGQIVGRADRDSLDPRATLFDSTGGGKNIDLGTLEGDHYSRAHDINDVGRIVGRSSSLAPNDPNCWRAALFDPSGGGANVDLGTLGGNAGSARAINNIGQIVGCAETVSDSWYAALFDPTGGGNNIDLNDYTNMPTGWTLTEALDINNKGWIVGSAENPEGQDRAFLLKPVLEPVQKIVLDWEHDAPITVSRKRWFGHGIDNYIFALDGSMPHSSVSQEFRDRVLQEVQRIFADSGVSNIVVREGRKEENASTVYFTLSPFGPFFGIKGWAFTGIDRFNTALSGGAVVFLPNWQSPGQEPETDPEDRAEVIAHEIGHLLGLRHIKPPGYAEIMEQNKHDFDQEIFNNVVSAITDPGWDFGTLHNPLYHLKRYVDGVEHDILVSSGIMPGEWDIRLGQEHLCMDVQLRFPTADMTLYDLNVLADRGEDTWEVIRHYDQISLSELSDVSLTLPLDVMFQLAAASQEAGEWDIVLATGDPYDSVNLSILPQEGEFLAFLQAQSDSPTGYDTIGDAWVTGEVVPEPATMTLFLAAGTLMLFGSRRLRRRNSLS